MTANLIDPMQQRGTVGYSRQNGRRRRSVDARRNESLLTWHDAAHDKPASELLANTLGSACDLIGAQRGFVLVLCEETTLEIACTRHLPTDELLDCLLGSAARALHRALALAEPGLAGSDGNLLSSGCADAAPAIVSLPLDLGLRQRGAMCLLRDDTPRCLSKLDFEILAALSGQAELALAAASQHCALSRLKARLTSAPSPELGR